LANDKKTDLRPRCDVHADRTMEYTHAILPIDRSNRLIGCFAFPADPCKRGFNYMFGYFDTSKAPRVSGGLLCKVHFEHLVVQEPSRGVLQYVCPVVFCREALEMVATSRLPKGLKALVRSDNSTLGADFPVRGRLLSQKLTAKSQNCGSDG